MRGEEYKKQYFEVVDSTIATGSHFEISSENFNMALRHIYNLLKDACFLYCKGSYNLSIFLAITAMEECAKLHVSLYRSHNNAPQKSETERNDKLFDHKTKHRIACAPTVSMGQRLVNAIGRDAIQAICAKSQQGTLRIDRENALYMQENSLQWDIPENIYSKKESLEFVLFAIETVDDQLAGYTEESLSIQDELDELFTKIAGDNHETDDGKGV